MAKSNFYAYHDLLGGYAEIRVDDKFLGTEGIRFLEF